jgi:hypothetical protein
METYETGNSEQQISLAVDISTFALAASSASIKIVDQPTAGISVAQSENASGDISTQPIGKASDIQNKRLTILTKIDLIGSLEDRKNAFDDIDATYTLSGGPNGLQTYVDPLKSVDEDFTTVLLAKPIDLI